MPYDFDHILTPENTESGIAEMLLIAPFSAFAANGIKCPQAPFSNPGDEVTIKVPHVFAANEGFIEVRLAPEKNQLTAETVGDKGFQKLRENVEVMIAGSNAKLHEFAKNIKNQPLIVLARDSNCEANMWYQIGCDCEGCYATLSFGTGTTAEGNKGYTINFSRMSNHITLYAPLNQQGQPIDPMSQKKP